VESGWLRRQQVWDFYMQALSPLPLGLPAPPEADTRHALHLYTVMVDKARFGITRDEFLSGMNAQGVGTGVHYLSIPEHPYYQQRFGWRPEQWPNAMKIGRETVSLPLTTKLTDGDLQRVVSAVGSLAA
jgi:dTDP-4-amino-4,6-dideoxygalactose transaminase